MRQPGKIGMASAAAVLLMALGQPAGAQNPVGNAGDDTTLRRVGAPNAPANARGAETFRAAVGQDNLMLIAHGLEMVIEGSTLQGMAIQAGALTATPPPVAPAAGLRPVPAEVTGTAARIGTTPIVDGTRPASPGPEASPTPIAAATGNAPTALLLQQAQRSFESGGRLLERVNLGTDPDQRFLQAANRYVTTLRTLGGPIGRTDASGVGNGTGGPGTFPSSTSVTGYSGTGRPSGAPVGALASGGMTINGNDVAAVALINHGVKEAIGSLRIRRMVGAMGSTNDPAAQQLLAHAREMDAACLAITQGLGAMGPGGGAGAGVPNGVVPTLAQQANDLILAMQALGSQAAPAR